MRVTLFQRRPQGSNFSIERLFADVRRALPANVDATVAVCRFASRGIWRRAYNMIEAVCRQGDVNHVTGDVHFLALLLNKRRTVLTIHDLVSLHRLGGLRRAVFGLLWYRLPIQRAGVITVVSESTKKELLGHIKIDSHKVRVVYDCVSDDFRPNRARFNADKPVILQIGTGPNKNIERVGRALQGIRCHYRVIGKLSETQRTALQTAGVEHSAASRLSDEALVEEYRRSDMVVFASTYEGFGLPIVEAQATGRPVVTSNILSMPEVAGDGACLVDPFDEKSIREGVLKVMKSPAYAEDLVRRGFANVERFRPDRIAAQYAEIYRELARATAGNTTTADGCGWQSYGPAGQGSWLP